MQSVRRWRQIPGSLLDCQVAYKVRTFLLTFSQSPLPCHLNLLSPYPLEQQQTNLLCQLCLETLAVTYQVSNGRSCSNCSLLQTATGLGDKGAPHSLSC